MPPLLADANPAGAALMVVLFIVGGLVYFLPSGIAIARRHPNIGPILIVNTFLGWLCVGWILALAWCLSAGPGQQNVYIGRGKRRYDDD